MPINVETASKLLDFRGRISEAAAREQLEGSVALHNLLEQHSLAYLADEVGMGKTYVALGAFALFRHFDPTFRLLVIAPRANIQEKWIRELRNFVKNNYNLNDLRVKAIHDAPARSTVSCANLYDFLREARLDPHRDFFVRFGSFSFGLSEDVESLKRVRQRFLKELPWLDPDLFSLKSREVFKGNVARAVCCAMPVFDLVIVDEGHNLKHGIAWNAKKQSSRNRLLALAFGGEGEEIDAYTRRAFSARGLRAKRVLFLSATPIENDYRQLYNQLAIFGKADVASRLIDPDATEEEKRVEAQKFLIRRLTSMKVGDEEVTKNLYRREWRSGGVDTHDDELRVPDAKQRLIVGLMQKKVSELLGSERFNQSFQIGMLSSFESFLQTAKVLPDEATFDDAEQTEDAVERNGIDVHAVNRIADNYWRTFQERLPHPKMDALVDRLASSFENGQKALVFVRRVRSVTEIQQKLERRYDDWLIAKLRAELSPQLVPVIEEQYERYRAETLQRRQATTAKEKREDENAGGNETFFAWFFRGKGPPDVLSGASFVRRFISQGSLYATFFDDNYVADLLDAQPGRVLGALARLTDLGEPELRAELRRRAGRQISGAARQQRKPLFNAFQFAALDLLKERSKEYRDRAGLMLSRLYDGGTREEEAPDASDYLELPTFFTALREPRWSNLRAAIWPDDSAAAHQRYGDALERFEATFVRRELRRELIGSMLRLGHGLIDFYILVANRIGTLAARARDESDSQDSTIFTELLALLEKQSLANRFSAFRELAEAAANFDLILDVNEPEAWRAPLATVPTLFGRLLHSQQPIGGMFAEVNTRMVRQFRMPGYPFVLITTDLLQEGEDLHTFCSSVYHYGISWMPSSMEQRIGRIDRVSSQTERRLNATPQPLGNDLLQVYYPHLRETVEVFQVNRVLERMNTFLRLMHEKLGSDEHHERYVNVAKEIAEGVRSVPQITEKLTTAFPIRSAMLRGESRALAVPIDFAMRAAKRIGNLLQKIDARWEPVTEKNARIGVGKVGSREQPFTMVLHSIEGRLCIRCVSPIGKIDLNARREEIEEYSLKLPVRIGAVLDPRFNQYELTAEGDLLLTGDDQADAARLALLVRTVSSSADALEDVLLKIDAALFEFRHDLEQEAQFER